MKIYYWDYYSDEGIASDTPREADLEFALDVFYGLTDEEDNFFGVVDPKEKSIQFIFVEQDKWLVDIPSPPDFINHQKYADYDECIALIKAFYAGQDIPATNKGFCEVDVKTETLNDVL
ncbi:hypothetical protein [Sinomicrobium sp.]